MGGAGKTPVALELAALLRAAGRNPAFLARGFGGKERGPYSIQLAADNSERVGDEAPLLARAAPTIVSRDRVAGAKLAEKSAADIIVMDDGFQNPSLVKDFSLVVVDGGAGLGSGRVFPLGPLRAPLAFQMALASAIVVLGSGRPARRLAAQLSGEKFASIPLFEADIVPIVPPEIVTRPVVAFCGIGRPSKFFETVERAGIRIAKRCPFPDHHRYSEADAHTLMTEAKALGAALLTTEKDHVRLKGRTGILEELFRSAVPLPIAVEFLGDGRERIMRAIEAAIASRYCASRP